MFLIHAEMSSVPEPTVRSFDWPAEIFRAPNPVRVILRRSPVYGPDAAVSALASRPPTRPGETGGFLRIDPVAVEDGRGLLDRCVRHDATRSDQGRLVVVLDGLERASPLLAAGQRWLAELAAALVSADIVVVLRTDLPLAMPGWQDVQADESPAADYPSLTATVEENLAESIDAVTGKGARRDVVEQLLGELALLAQNGHGGCDTTIGSALALAGTLRCDEPQSFVDSLVAAGILGLSEPGPVGPARLWFQQTCAKEYLAGAAVWRRIAAGDPVPIVPYREQEFYSDHQDFSSVRRHSAWLSSTRFLAHRSDVDVDLTARRLAPAHPALATAALAAASDLTIGTAVEHELALSHARSTQRASLTPADRATVRISQFRLLCRSRGRSAGAPVVPEALLPRGGNPAEPSALAPYLVTNLEFSAFIIAGGYQDPRRWSAEGWDWLTGPDLPDNLLRHWVGYLGYLRRAGIERLREVRRWRIERYELLKHLVGLDEQRLPAALGRIHHRRRDMPASWSDRRFNAAAKPVVGVTLHEAEAYCAWLSARLGRAVALPTAQRWSRGTGIRTTGFPWGGQFRTGLANTQEEGLAATTPVGSYPPSGKRAPLFDVAGNAWEWMSTAYSDGFGGTTLVGKVFDGVRYVVVRGGSWDNTAPYARCDAFDVDPPEIFGTRLGFRALYGDG